LTQSGDKVRYTIADVVAMLEQKEEKAATQDEVAEIMAPYVGHFRRCFDGS